MIERPPEALVTTPESVSLLLSQPGFFSSLPLLRMIVMDEWHELLSTKRGVLAELALARLRTLAPQVNIWGLSATLGNTEEAATTLGGILFPGKNGPCASYRVARSNRRASKPCSHPPTKVIPGVGTWVCNFSPASSTS